MAATPSFRDKLNTFRLLQQEVESRNKKTRRRGWWRFFNSANFLLLIIGFLATYGTIDVAIKTNTLPEASIILSIQTMAICIFFVTKKYDWLLTRILLISYLLFYFVVLYQNGGLAIAPYWMFSYILFAFVSVGTREGFLWLSFHFGLLLGAIYVDAQAKHPLLGHDMISITIETYLLLTAFAFLLDYTSRIIVARVERQSSDLEEANVRYDVILNSIGDGMLAVDQNGDIEFANKQAVDLLGVQRQDILGEPAIQHFRLYQENELVPQSHHPLQHVLKKGLLVQANLQTKDHYYLRREDKTSFPVAMTISPVRVIGKSQGAILLFHDMTAEEEVDKSKTEFVSLASHQLRTPLNITSWYLEKLLSGRKGKLNNKQAEYLHELEINNQRMLNLVTDLLTVSRVELGKIKPKGEKVDSAKLLKSLVKEVSPEIERKNIRLHMTIEAKETELTNADVSFVTVIFQNLLSNAVKYTPAEGSIDIILRTTKRGELLHSDKNLVSSASGIVMSVKDTGIGIPNDQSEKIFSKLFRAQNAEAVDVSGTGLGLYVTQNFAHTLGGFVWFISAEDKGTNFSVYLPFDHNEVSHE